MSINSLTKKNWKFLKKLILSFLMHCLSTWNKSQIQCDRAITFMQIFEKIFCNFYWCHDFNIYMCLNLGMLWVKSLPEPTHSTIQKGIFDLHRPSLWSIWYLPDQTLSDPKTHSTFWCMSYFPMTHDIFAIFSFRPFYRWLFFC